MAKMTELEKEYIKRIDYRFNMNSNKTKDIFNTVTEVLYKEFLINPSISNLRLNLENIINGSLDNFQVENKIKINILKSRYNIKNGFNGREYYMYDASRDVNYNSNDIVKAIKDVVLAQYCEEYHEIIMYYIVYICLKCKDNAMFDFIGEKLEKSTRLEVDSILKFKRIFTSKESIDEYIKDKEIKLQILAKNYYNYCNNYNKFIYKETINEFAAAAMDDKFTENGKITYVDDSLLTIKEGLPTVERILYKKNDMPNAINN